MFTSSRSIFWSFSCTDSYRYSRPIEPKACRTRTRSLQDGFARTPFSGCLFSGTTRANPPPNKESNAPTNTNQNKQTTKTNSTAQHNHKTKGERTTTRRPSWSASARCPQARKAGAQLLFFLFSLPLCLAALSGFCLSARLTQSPCLTMIHRKQNPAGRQQVIIFLTTGRLARRPVVREILDFV